jgi:hypothetical protein
VAYGSPCKIIRNIIWQLKKFYYICKTIADRV